MTQLSTIFFDSKGFCYIFADKHFNITHVMFEIQIMQIVLLLREHSGLTTTVRVRGIMFKG